LKNEVLTNQSNNSHITKNATIGFQIKNLRVLVLAERVEQRGKHGRIGLPPNKRLHVVERADRLPRHTRGDVPPGEHCERAWRSGAVGGGVNDDPPCGVELARAGEGVDHGVVGVGRGARVDEGCVEARGVEEREGELGRAAEAEEELNEEIPGEELEQ